MSGKKDIKLKTLIIACCLLLISLIAAFSDNTLLVETAEAKGNGIIVGNSVVYGNSYGTLTVTPAISTNIITQEQEAVFESNITANIDLAFRFPFALNNPNIWMWQNIGHNVNVPDYGDITANYTLVNISDFSLIDEPDSVMLGDIPSDRYAVGNASFWDGITWWNTNFTIGFDSWSWFNPEHTECNFTYEYWGQTGSHVEEKFWFDWKNIKHRLSYQQIGEYHYYIAVNWSVTKNHSYLFKWQYDTPITITPTGWGSSGKWDLMAKL
ncbi:unnamed protein product, partial [marine sediment metagenome]